MERREMERIEKNGLFVHSAVITVLIFADFASNKKTCRDFFDKHKRLVYVFRPLLHRSEYCLVEGKSLEIQGFVGRH